VTPGEILLYIVIVGLLICDIRLRLPWLHVLMAVFTAYVLLSETGLNPAVRRSLVGRHPVYFPTPPSQPRRLASEFESGVLVMYEEAARDLKHVMLPAFVLAWLAISPVLFGMAPVVRGSARRKGTGAETSP
jgi:hypothetical protein